MCCKSLLNTPNWLQPEQSAQGERLRRLGASFYGASWEHSQQERRSKEAQRLSIMACHDLQVMEEVLDALTESVQKQQRAQGEVQKRFHEEASQPGCHKQKRKELTERLQVEDAKLEKKQQNLREVQSLRESWPGMYYLLFPNTAFLRQLAQ